MMTQIEQLCIEQTREWIQSFIIKYNLCPFAKREMDKGSVKIHYSRAKSAKSALADLKTEMEYLTANPETETIFLLFPLFLHDFFDFLDFVDLAEMNLVTQGYEGIYQLATFHPEYCFADANVDDVTNYTNRSPYPMLHLLREESIEKAVHWFGNTGTIPETNMTRLRALGLEEVEKIVTECLQVTCPVKG